ncbi:MAG TPA: cupin domain-containing protein [Nodosilinea sp.]|nr:cupin domain-containing protein [Nodosilinea sp.]
MTEINPSVVLKNMFAIASFQDELPWQTFREGVEIISLHQTTAPQTKTPWLGSEPQPGLHTALLRYQPGATVPYHHHPGSEQILVLAGAQQDDRGIYPAGTLVVNPPGSNHRVASPEGCIVLVTWERPVIFQETDFQEADFQAAEPA